MNEEAFNTMYDLAKREGYKQSPEEFKNLLDTNDNALNTMFELSKKEGYNGLIEDFKFLMGTQGSGGASEGFTEGSVEQQEQPTEPLEKPMPLQYEANNPELLDIATSSYDVDVNENNKEAASKFSWDDGTPKPTLEVTTAQQEQDISPRYTPRLPEFVIDYSSYNVEQLDSALIDINKRKEQADFTLSTHGLTQPQRTEAKKQKEELKNKLAVAKAYKATKSSDFSMVDEFIEAIGYVGPNTATGKELTSEWGKYSKSLNEAIDPLINELDIDNLTEIDYNGTERADVEKVSQKAKEISEKIAPGEEKVFDLVL